MKSPRIRRAILTALTAVATLASASPSSHDLPDFGEPADLVMSPREELQIGRDIVAQLYEHNVILDDPEIDHYLNLVGLRLASHVQNRPDQMLFFMVRDPRINAFALPGGFVGINAGLMTAASSESELAGVLAHEIAHITQRHIARTIDGTQATSMASWLAVLAAILIGSATPDVVLAALSLGQAAAYQNQVNYTRAHELEADRLGIRTLAAAGFDPRGMADFFVRLEQQSRLYGSGLPEILRTHPVNTTRIAEARTRALEYSPREVADSLEFRVVRARTRVLVADRPSAAVNYFGEQLNAGNDTPENRYGLALALLELGQARRAEQVLTPALAVVPDQANLLLLMARAALARNDTEEALRRYAHAAELFPRHAPVLLAYADALLATGHLDEARNLLVAREMTLGTHANTYRLLARIAQADKDAVESAYQMARYYMARGDMRSALRRLDAALRMQSLSAQARARLAALRKEIRDSLPDNFRLDPEPSRRQGAAALSRAAPALPPSWPHRGFRP